MLRAIKKEGKESARIAIAEAKKMAKSTEEEYRAMIRDFKKEDEEMAKRARRTVAAVKSIGDFPRPKIISLAAYLSRKGTV